MRMRDVDRTLGTASTTYVSSRAPAAELTGAGEFRHDPALAAGPLALDIRSDYSWPGAQPRRDSDVVQLEE
jgi:hypothetical protein